MIITKDGKKEIQDIQAGEEVLSADSYTGEVSYKKVLKTVCLEVETLVYVSVNGELIETTTEHPFWVEGVGFVPAYALKKGDALRLDDGSDVSIECVEIQHLDEPVKVYNFTVEDNHTYYAGDSGVLVHNAECGKPKKTGTVKPESKVTGSKKHGVKWKEGRARAIKENKPQGQWAKKDLDYATEMANTLESGESAYFDLLTDSESIVHMPDGTTQRATRMWIRNNGTGTWHGYPCLNE